MTREEIHPDCVGFSLEYFDDVTKLAIKYFRAYEIFMFLTKNMDNQNKIMITNTKLQEIFDCSKVTICRAVKYLKENEFIYVEKVGPTNMYMVNPKIALTSNIINEETQDKGIRQLQQYYK